MANTIESTELIRWDLSILYADIADPRLDSDLSELTAMAKHFSLTYKGKLAELLGGGDPGLFGNRDAQRQDQLLPVFAREHGPDQRGDQGQARRLSARTERDPRGAPHLL